MNTQLQWDFTCQQTLLFVLSASLCVLRFSGASGQAEGDGLCGHPAQTDPIL